MAHLTRPDELLPPSFSEFDIGDTAVAKSVRTWLNSDLVWQAVPRSSQPVQPNTNPFVCVSPGVEEQKKALWTYLSPLAVECCRFRPTGHELIRAPEKGLILETDGSPHLILPLQFETWKDFVSKGQKTMWLKEGKAIFTRETITMHGPVTFYFLNIKVRCETGYLSQMDSLVTFQ